MGMVNQIQDSHGGGLTLGPAGKFRDWIVGGVEWMKLKYRIGWVH